MHSLEKASILITNLSCHHLRYFEELRSIMTCLLCLHVHTKLEWIILCCILWNPYLHNCCTESHHTRFLRSFFVCGCTLSHLFLFWAGDMLPMGNWRGPMDGCTYSISCHIDEGPCITDALFSSPFGFVSLMQLTDDQTSLKNRRKPKSVFILWKTSVFAGFLF